LALIRECPLCGGTERYYSFLSGDERFDECRDCGLLSHNAAKGVEANEVVEYSAGRDAADEPELVAALFSLLDEYLGPDSRRMGVAGELSTLFLEEAGRHGFETTAIQDERPSHAYSIVAVMNLLENTPTPVTYVESLRGHLREGGVVALVARQLVKAGWQAGTDRILERRQRYSFSDTNLQTILWKAGFGEVFLSHHISEQDGIRAQGWFKDQAIAFGRMREQRVVPKLTVVVPVFNEVSTVGRVLDALRSKEIPGLDMEVIVVESASTDGSREVVRGYRDHPRFRVVLEDQPRGKGFAVRTGLRHVTGDVVLIQDADLEYDFLDYEMLVAPILSGRAAFVLGTRHAGHWKIRRFAQHFLADVLNLAHWVLVYVMNRLYGQSMTDPFTMFKVFRADCLSGLEFECNRFDFDVELVCKLVRKGYLPLEIPVNYQARSFEEGKKVRMFRDPFTWIRAMLKYRTSSVLRRPGVGDTLAATSDSRAADS
jgi:hypothetical protein